MRTNHWHRFERENFNRMEVVRDGGNENDDDDLSAISCHRWRVVERKSHLLLSFECVCVGSSAAHESELEWRMPFLWRHHPSLDMLVSSSTLLFSMKLWQLMSFDEMRGDAAEQKSSPIIRNGFSSSVPPLFDTDRKLKIDIFPMRFPGMWFWIYIWWHCWPRPCQICSMQSICLAKWRQYWICGRL